eukprot:COSAG02_NODE_146_length_33985_cov_263.461695_1_plen_79_part_00
MVRITRNPNTDSTGLRVAFGKMQVFMRLHQRFAPTFYSGYMHLKTAGSLLGRPEWRVSRVCAFGARRRAPVRGGTNLL